MPIITLCLTTNRKHVTSCTYVWMAVSSYDQQYISDSVNLSEMQSCHHGQIAQFCEIHSHHWSNCNELNKMWGSSTLLDLIHHYIQISTRCEKLCLVLYINFWSWVDCKIPFHANQTYPPKIVPCHSWFCRWAIMLQDIIINLPVTACKLNVASKCFKFSLIISLQSSTSLELNHPSFQYL